MFCMYGLSKKYWPIITFGSTNYPTLLSDLRMVFQKRGSTVVQYYYYRGRVLPSLEA